jgi:hypothetical protein
MSHALDDKWTDGYVAQSWCVIIYWEKFPLNKKMRARVIVNSDGLNYFEPFGAVELENIAL